MAVSFDGLGVPVATAVMGKSGAGEGDTLADPTSTLEYDLFAWQTSSTPNFFRARSRETHADPNTRWQESRTYFDGSGRTIMVKAQAEPGLAPERDANGDLVLDGNGDPILADTSPNVRWVGTGRTVYDNKGNPVKQYEPYFSSIPDFEDEAELVEQGVTPILDYDPLGRLIRTDFPNGTFSTVEFTPWESSAYDPNDNVLQSTWYSDRINYAGSDPALVAEQRAASLTEAHDSTPTRTALDALGRAFLVVEDAGSGTRYPIRSDLDIEGNVLSVTDARGNMAETNVYGMAGRLLQTDSEDAGWRRSLTDVVGNPIRSWNERGFTHRMVYDALLRPTDVYVTPPAGTEMLAQRTVYGETVGATAADDNLRRRVFRVYDGAGAATSERYDFKGNLRSSSRQLAVAYDSTADWSALASESTISGMETAAASDSAERDVHDDGGLRRAEPADAADDAGRLADGADVQRGGAARDGGRGTAGGRERLGVRDEHRLRRQGAARADRLRERGVDDVRVRAADVSAVAALVDALERRGAAAGPAIHVRPGRKHRGDPRPGAAAGVLRERGGEPGPAVRVRPAVPADAGDGPGVAEPGAADAQRADAGAAAGSGRPGGAADVRADVRVRRGRQPDAGPAHGDERELDAGVRLRERRATG